MRRGQRRVGICGCGRGCGWVRIRIDIGIDIGMTLIWIWIRIDIDEMVIQEQGIGQTVSHGAEIQLTPRSVHGEVVE